MAGLLRLSKNSRAKRCMHTNQPEKPGGSNTAGNGSRLWRQARLCAFKPDPLLRHGDPL